VRAVIIVVDGAIVGEVVKEESHPNAARIWLSHVDIGDGGGPKQIVYGGDRRLSPGEMVPVAPPGARVAISAGQSTEFRFRKMRARNFRGQRSHGMLCSLLELNWVLKGLDEVAVLDGSYRPGQPLRLPSATRGAVKWQAAPAPAPVPVLLTLWQSECLDSVPVLQLSASGR